MELHQVRYVQAVAECGSFTAAASRLFLAQPSLSVQVRKLERELRTQLFDRSGGQTRLTPAGARFLEHAGIALAELDLARQAAQEPDGERDATRVSLGTLPSIAAGLVPDLLRHLLAGEAGVSVTTVDRDTSDELVSLVAKGELDVAVVGVQALRSGLASRALAREPLAALLPPGHRMSGRPDGAYLREFAGEPVVALPEGSPLRDAMDAAFARVGLAPQIAVEARHLASVWAMVQAGLGIGVLPALAVDPRLPFVLLLDEFLHRDMVVVWQPRTGTDDPRASVVDALVDIAARRYASAATVASRADSSQRGSVAGASPSRSSALPAV